MKEYIINASIITFCVLCIWMGELTISGVNNRFFWIILPLGIITIILTLMGKKGVWRIHALWLLFWLTSINAVYQQYSYERRTRIDIEEQFFEMIKNASPTQSESPIQRK